MLLVFVKYQVRQIIFKYIKSRQFPIRINGVNAIFIEIYTIESLRILNFEGQEHTLPRQSQRKLVLIKFKNSEQLKKNNARLETSECWITGDIDITCFRSTIAQLTTSALLDIIDNIFQAVDDLVLLDFSDAFDTISHELLCLVCNTSFLSFL